jgi:hypothetical protein
MNIPTGDYIIEFYSPDGGIDVAKTCTASLYEHAIQAGQQNICDKYPHFRVLKVMMNSNDKARERWECGS